MAIQNLSVIVQSLKIWPKILWTTGLEEATVKLKSFLGFTKSILIAITGWGKCLRSRKLWKDSWTTTPSRSKVFAKRKTDVETWIFRVFEKVYLGRLCDSKRGFEKCLDGFGKCLSDEKFSEMSENNLEAWEESAQGYKFPNFTYASYCSRDEQELRAAKITA